MLSHDLGKYVPGINAHGRSYPRQFQNVDPALAGFVGTDEGLRLAQLRREVLLPQAGPRPEFSEDSANNPMLFGANPHDRSPGHDRPGTQLYRII